MTKGTFEFTKGGVSKEYEGIGEDKKFDMKNFILGILVGALPFLFILWYFWNDLFGLNYPI